MLFTYVSSPFTPASIANLAAWYDASDTATITQVANAVSQWNDKSTNTYNMTQGSGTQQPTTGASLNSLNAISWDGSSDRMYIPAGIYTLTNGDFSIYVVGQKNATGNDGALFRFSGGGGETKIRTDFSDTQFNTSAGSSDNSFGYTSDTNTHIFYLAKDSTTAYSRRDAATGTPYAAVSRTSTLCTIGAWDSGGGGVYNNMKYGEIIMVGRYIAYGSAEDLEIRSYLSRWGV